MNRKQWIIAGIIVTVLIVIGVMFMQSGSTGEVAETIQGTPAADLVYCSEEQVRPCVVSFSIDADENMLVNILLPDLSFPSFYLKIRRGGSETDYKCQRVGTALNNAYCIGEKMPPGEILHLMLISTKDEALLAEGDLSIIALALPTLAVVSPTSETATPDLTTTPLAGTSTMTPTQPQSPFPSKPTPTQSAYPNPSYPKPSYP